MKFTKILPELKIASCLIAFFSAAIQAFGMYNIHALADITEGGVLGATLLLEHWLKISPAVSSFILNAICYLVGWRILGKKFVGYSVIAACGYSVCYGICEQFPPLWPGIVEVPLLAALIGALFIGVGAGFCVRAGGATSGDDALAMSMSHITKIPIQWIYLISDLAVLGLSVSYIPVWKIGYSLLTVVLSGQVIGAIQRFNK